MPEARALEHAALRAAASVETTLGPRAGLVAYRALAASSDGELHALAVLGALRCAAFAGDLDAVRSVRAAWRRCRGSRTLAVAELCDACFARGEDESARAVAEAEFERSPTAVAAWLVASCAMRLGAADAAQTLDVVVHLDPTSPLGATASARALILRGGPPQAAREALRVAGLTHVELRSLAHLALECASLYGRLEALDVLRALAVAGDAYAVRLAAAFADARRTSLHPLEVDRVIAILRTWPEPSQRALAIERVLAWATLVSGSTESVARLDALRARASLDAKRGDRSSAIAALRVVRSAALSGRDE